VLTLAGQYRVVGGLDARLPRAPREALT
jgi:hypothetical protein